MIHILQQRYGVQFDYDQRDGTYLVVSLSPLQGRQLVSHQLQMLINNRIPQLLHVELDSINESYKLHYDITAKRRLFQTLQTSPPTIQLFYEMAYRLVQTISDSNMYMLNEEQYILHGDLIYCGSDVADLYVCYLPLLTTYTVRIEDQLRLLLLRMLATVDSLSSDNEDILKVIRIIQEEDYLIINLKNALKDAWMKQGVSGEKKMLYAQHPVTKQDSKSNNDHVHVWEQIRSIWNKKLKSQPHKTKKTNKADKAHAMKSISTIDYIPITGVTEMLIKKQVDAPEEIRLMINKNGVEEVVPFREDRFVIGRNQTGVDYMDTTEGISRVHCEFMKSIDSIELRDLGSLNGSYLNGELLIPYKSYRFAYGDLLRIVTTEIRIVN